MGAVVPEDCRFTLSDELPRAELPFEDSQGWTHDLLYVTEAMYSVSRLAATRYLRIPAHRPLAVTRATVTIDDTGSWRHTGKSGHATTDLRLRRTMAADGTARLECDATVLVQSTPYATGTLSLELGRQSASATATTVHRRGLPLLAHPLHRPLPAQVARSDPRNVVLANPKFGPGPHLAADIAPDPDNPVFDPAVTDRACAALLAEATRQAAVLTACERYGFTPAHFVPARWTAQFPPDVASGLPLRCRAVPGPVFRDGLGRPAVTVDLALFQSQSRAPLGAISITLVLDC